MNLTRCNSCVLPETVPFLELDSAGVCRHCRQESYTRERPSEQKLTGITSQLKTNGRGENCVVALSGGRDSSFVLHFVTQALGLKPAVLTYDWGMLTPTGAQNQRGMINQLGLREITISDKVETKRKNIRRNILAWLHRPSLGLVPLFMAGDKHFFYHASKVKKQEDLDQMFFGITDMEAEDFKEGFCGVRSRSFSDGKQHYGLTVSQKLRVISFYGAEYILNPRLINLSISETLFGFFSYYIFDHGYFTNLYEHVEWDEDKITNTIEQNYGWQREPDNPSSWRTGDASTPFISYVFLTLAGFTENDFLRSNQVRRGIIDREEALKRLASENIVRHEGLELFCKLVEIDYDFLTQRIESLPKLRD